MLIIRKLLILQTDKKDKTAKKTISLYVYCTVQNSKFFGDLSSFRPHKSKARQSFSCGLFAHPNSYLASFVEMGRNSGDPPLQAKNIGGAKEVFSLPSFGNSFSLNKIAILIEDTGFANFSIVSIRLNASDISICLP